MLRRHKTHILIISVALMILFVAGPPVTMASNLPTVCNIFSHEKSEKAEPCGHRAIFSKAQDKSSQVEAVMPFDVDFENGNFLIIQSNPLSVTLAFESNSQSTPLRC